MAYSYLAVDVLTSRVIDDLPFVNASFGDVLNGAGQIKGDVILDTRLATPEAQARGLVVDPDGVAAMLEATVPGKVVVVVFRDGVPLIGGPIWSRRWQHSTGRLEVTGAHIWSYARRRVMANPVEYTAADQATIANSLVTDAFSGQAPVHTLTTPATGVVRDRTGYERGKNLAEAVEQLAAVSNGFDFSMDYSLEGGVYKPRFVTHYPRRGLLFDETPWVFELGHNLTDYEIDEDGTRQTTRPLVVGQGEGDSQLRATATNAAALAEGWPILEQVESRTDVQEQLTIDLIATTKAEVYGHPAEVWKATIKADVDPVIGSWQTGDVARFVISDARFPTGFDGYMRIIGWDCDPGEGGGLETVQLTLTHDVGV